MPLLPIQATPHLSSMILIALSTCKPVKRKYADYIALEMLALINRVDPGKTIFNQILFDDASNVLKAGLIIRPHFPRAEVNHGAEHVVALQNFQKWYVTVCVEWLKVMNSMKNKSKGADENT
jgi:hypothetical protein